MLNNRFAAPIVHQKHVAQALGTAGLQGSRGAFKSISRSIQEPRRGSVFPFTPNNEASSFDMQAPLGHEGRLGHMRAVSRAGLFGDTDGFEDRK